jgi:CO dehydrogenase maturation factor
VFKMNPDVADVAERFGTPRGGVSLLVLGAVNKGGSGCACPENTFIKALVTDMVLYKKDTLVMDMEAGIEHLGRATTRGVDLMIAVAEPGQRAADCVANVTRMAADIGLKRVAAVGNKIRGPEDEAFLRAALPDLEFLAMIPYTEALRAADRDGMSVMDAAAADPALAREFASLYEKVSTLADRREGRA